MVLFKVSKYALSLLFTALFIVSFFVPPAAADRVILKNGKEVQGTIIDQNEEFIKVEFNNVTLTFFTDEIESIEKSPIETSPPENEAGPMAGGSAPVIIIPQEALTAQAEQTITPVEEARASAGASSGRSENYQAYVNEAKDDPFLTKEAMEHAKKKFEVIDKSMEYATFNPTAPGSGGSRSKTAKRQDNSFSAAKQKIRAIVRGCDHFKRVNSKYPSELEELTRADNPYVDSDFLKTLKDDEYRYFYHYLDEEHFSITAKPDDPKKDVIYTDETGKFRINDKDGEVIH